MLLFFYLLLLQVVTNTGLFKLKCNTQLAANYIMQHSNVHLNYLQYFQLIAAIPNHLKKHSMENVIPDRSILEECNSFHLSDNKTILLTKMRCKDYYQVFSGIGYNRTYNCKVFV